MVQKMTIPNQSFSLEKFQSLTIGLLAVIAGSLGHEEEVESIFNQLNIKYTKEKSNGNFTNSEIRD